MKHLLVCFFVAVTFTSLVKAETQYSAHSGPTGVKIEDPKEGKVVATSSTVICGAYEAKDCDKSFSNTATPPWVHYHWYYLPTLWTADTTTMNFANNAARVTTWQAPTVPGHYTLTCTPDTDAGTLVPGEGAGAPASRSVWAINVQKLNYSIQSGGSGDVDGTLFVPIGSDITFTAVKNPSDAPSWPQGKPTWSGSARSDWSGTGGENAVQASFPTASSSTGDYKTVRATCGNYAQANVIVVAVGSLTPSDATEVDDGDEDPDTRMFYVQVCNPPTSITVTAAPQPAVSEDQLPADWTLTGGTGSGLLTRTIDKTSPGEVELTCTCGSSTKTTKIFIIESEYEAYADPQYNPVGHGWWRLQLYPLGDAETYLLTPPQKNAQGEAGYFPEGVPTPTAPGMLIFGGQGHSASASYTWQITYSNLISSLNYTRGLYNACINDQETYHLLDNNCVTKTKDAAMAASISIDCSDTPQDLAQYLSEL